MTHALVVYESMFGNTQLVAQAVAEGLASAFEVTLAEVGEAPESVPPDTRLLVVGAPTHAFGLSRPETRRDAAREVEVPLVSAGPGLREWLEALPQGSTPTACFDTRVLRPRLPGSAAKKAAKQLRRKGSAMVEDPLSFYVHDKAGPLADGERERARAWGLHLGQMAGQTGRMTPPASAAGSAR
jgi:Flavodoxin